MTTNIATLIPVGLPLPGGLPALTATAGEPTAWRFVEVFTATIRNPQTRTAYTHGPLGGEKGSVPGYAHNSAADRGRIPR